MHASRLIDKSPALWLRQLKQHPVISRLLHEQQYEDLAACLTNETSVKMLYQSLSERTRQMLLPILLRFGMGPFPEEQCHQFGQSNGSLAEVKITILELRRSGLLFAGRKSWGDRLLAFPAETFEHLIRLILSADPIKSVRKEEEDDAHVGIQEPDFQLAVLRFLYEVKMKGGLSITQKGTIHKRELQHLQGKKAFPEQDEWRYMPLVLGDHTASGYRPQEVVVLEYAHRHQLLKRQSGKLRIAEDECRTWLQLTYEQKQQQWLEMCRSYLLPSAPWLQCAWAWVIRQPAVEWFSAQGLFDLLQQAYDTSHAALKQEQAEEKNPPFTADSLETHLLLPLTCLGFLHLHHEEGKQQNQYRTAMASPKQVEPHLYVTADLTVYASPYAPSSLLWELFHYTDEESGCLHRKVTMSALQRAVLYGYQPEGVISLLKEGGGVPLRAETRALLADWIDMIGIAQVQEVMMVTFSHSFHLKMIQQHEPFRSSLVAVLHERACILEAEAWTEVEAYLGKHHCVSTSASSSSRLTDKPDRPEKQVKHVKESKESKVRMDSKDRKESKNRMDSKDGKQEESHTQGWLADRISLDRYTLESDCPDMEEIYSGMQDIPGMWLHQMRNYHASTVHKCIEQAIAWGARLRLKIKGEIMEITPRRLEASGPSWRVSCLLDGTPSSLFPEEWEQIQLILPGINDTTELTSEMKE
ncbi:hypothetical protein [Marinicrinis sediminis]|uniref:Helicase XPB/Ssl2 N-terminal domain-containing protein n=1 Tax=Marinicrinis sediminis TaxID=1652465 RepID=A0ABW5R5G7_9BACL